ncbi:MAG: hypothetical protein ACWA44_02685 [Thiotrichales bacterium]
MKNVKNALSEFAHRKPITIRQVEDFEGDLFELVSDISSCEYIGRLHWGATDYVYPLGIFEKAQELAQSDRLTSQGIKFRVHNYTDAMVLIVKTKEMKSSQSFVFYNDEDIHPQYYTDDFIDYLCYTKSRPSNGLSLSRHLKFANIVNRYTPVSTLPEQLSYKQLATEYNLALIYKEYEQAKAVAA